MTTYVQTTRNQLETPSGATGEVPDGPGEMQHLAQMVDDRLGVGGAEYTATTAARDAIPAARTFVGKLVFVASNQVVYRWNGTAWRPWSSDWAAFTPADGFTLGSGGTRTFAWRYVQGRAHVRGRWVFGTSPVIPSYARLPLPTNAADLYSGTWFEKCEGGGSYYPNGNTIDLVAVLISATNMQLYSLAGTPVTWTNVTGAAPAAIAAGMYITCDFKYDPA